jgi:hypothetical protein
VGYAPSYQGKSLSGQIANPGFRPLSSFNPYTLMFRHEQQQPNGWFYSFGHSRLILHLISPLGQSRPNYLRE